MFSYIDIIIHIDVKQLCMAEYTCLDHWPNGHASNQLSICFSKIL
jgi:hypothetical protein